MKKGLLLFIGFAALGPSLSAHEGHVHEAALEAPPHGGLLRNAGPYKAEAVLKGDTVQIYVYDEMLKPLSMDKKTIRAEVVFPRKKPKMVSFEWKGKFYEATISGIAKVHRYDLHVFLEIDKKKVMADFGIDNIQ